MEKTDKPGEEAEVEVQNDAENIDGKRMQRLKQSLDLSLDKFYSSIKFSLFKEQLRPLYEHQPQALKKMHAQLLAQLKSNVAEEITWMLKEENICKLLNGLNDLIDENPEKGKKGWRPSGNAAEDVLAHTAPYKLKEKERLQGILSDLQSQNKLLKDALRAKQTRLQNTQQRIEQKAEQWKQIDEMADRFDVEEAKQFLVKYSNYSSIR